MQGDSISSTTAPESPKREGKMVSDVIVGIPALNEEIAIGSLVLMCQRFASKVVVVDDGSTDRTAEIAEAAGAYVLQHGENNGKGRAVRSIFNYARGRRFDALVLLDGDGQHLPEDIPDVVRPIIEEDADLVIGNRYLGTRTDTPTYRRVGQRILDIFTETSSGVKVGDSQSGFRAFSPTAVQRLAPTTDGLGVESELITKAADADLTIEEAPIGVRYRGVDGQTFHPLRHGLSVLTFVVQLVRDRHPLIFFGLPGLLLLLAGTAYGLNAILVYQSTGQFYLAKALVSGFLTIGGILGLFAGLTLNSIANMIARLDQGRI